MPSPSTPEVPVSGLSRLATQTTASVDAENHIPTYLLMGTPGEKNPRVKAPPAETSVWPSVMLRRPSFRVSSRDETPAAEQVP